jgi:hypothetical protein
MKTFLKALLVLVAVVVALKLLPFALALGCVIVACISVVASIGLTVAAALVCTGLVLALVLSPVWLPVLAVVGMFALVKRVATRRA